MDARESFHRITQCGADIEQRRGVALDDARPLGRGAEQASSDQPKRRSSADLPPSVTHQKGGAAEYATTLRSRCDLDRYQVAPFARIGVGNIPPHQRT
jgi:hypothetical protein